MTDATDSKTLAVVIGADGGIGRAVVNRLRDSNAFTDVLALSRRSGPSVDITSEPSVEAAARYVSETNAPLRLVLVATGFLHDDAFAPERSLRHLNKDHLIKAFEINAIGPALIMKHFLPLLPRHGRSVFAVLSAKVGSIGDNRLGGWHSYRASKAALNQLMRTAAIELRRTKPDAICVALHPGTTDTPLSAPFAKAGLHPQSPETVAQRLVDLLQTISAERSGTLVDPHGATIPW